LKSPNCFFYLGVNQADVPVGQVRFEVSGTEAVISISLDAKFRGRGYGALMIQMASRLFFRSSSAQKTHAYIKTGNEASIKAFTRAGFRRVREMIIQDARAAHLVLCRSEVET
jgi:UDP-2,4-diacetamido-2,4,6-trideoxy-beta-L-altropyranose hydrolase